MKKVLNLIVPLSLLLMQACTSWPRIYVGDSSGIITYNRMTGTLEVLWEKHTQMKSSQVDTTFIDSIPKR
jgi:uncharacterized protein YcfL